jgi:hypothetical protein
VIPDARLGDFMRPVLWRVAGPRQVFLTSLLTNVIGPGPAAVATTLLPDLDHFRGSFGGRAVIPLWCDAAATQPNVAPGLLAELGVTAEMLLAYCYALLGTRSYVARFEEELRTPGPRIPLTADAEVFSRAVGLGRQLLAIHTYTKVPTGKARWLTRIGGDYPHEFTYDQSQLVLQIGQGKLGPVSEAVWTYSISGFRPLRAWMHRRVEPKKGKSPLDGITPRMWTAAMSQELLELVWLLEATVALEPALAAVLDDVVSGSGAQQLWTASLAQHVGDTFRPQGPREDVALPLVATELSE